MATTYTEALLSIDQLLLDPNNFRFQDERDYVSADPTRFAEPSVQQRAARRIRSEGLAELKNSILSNGFLAVERLVVREYVKNDAGQQLYLVLEGNRRAASLKWIKEDHEAGVSVPAAVLAVLSAVPVIVTESDEGEVMYLSIMGIRHVGGIKQWGGYQRAKLVGDLHDRFSLDTSEVADRLGMTKNEVNRRYRALKALLQMQEDEDFGDLAGPTLYPIFHEAVSLPIVRDWLGWNDSSMAFEDEAEVRKFYALVTPSASDEDEGGPQHSPKIASYAQVRDLRDILANPDAKNVLLDTSRTFGEALGVAKADELSASWRSEIAEATGALTKISAFDLESFDDTGLEAIHNLKRTVERVLETHAKLTAV